MKERGKQLKIKRQKKLKLRMKEVNPKLMHKVSTARLVEQKATAL